MHTNKDPTEMAAADTPAQPEADTPAPRTYDCTHCRYVDAHGLTCGFCLKKILTKPKEGGTTHVST